MLNISDYHPFDLKEETLSLNLSEDIHSYIVKKYFVHGEIEPSSWNKISSHKKSILEKHFDFSLPKIVWKGKSNDGTVKYLIAFNDKQTVEAVAIPTDNRFTLCVSSQVGCAIGCKFCHTGTMGLSRHLKSSEIVGQLLVIQKDLKTKITNIVFMGQGEPLHNFSEVAKSCHIFINPNGLALSKQKVTISTSGLVPQINRWKELPDVNLAISLHAITDEKRNKIMPINKAHDLERLFSSIKNLPQKPSRRISYEYILMKDFNDKSEDIDGLISLLPKKNSKINIIPFNDYPGSDFKSPTKEKVLWFQKELQSNGFITTIRQTRGDDILAACGQLKSNLERRNLW